MNENTIPATRPRIHELDFMKSVFILLMIAFHLVYIGNAYPYAKQLVYTFHMPGFLLISGYLFNIAKRPRQLFATLLWIFIPYAVMETGYTVMASVLPIRDHIDRLTVAVLAEKIVLSPLGPYWYLHTLVLCGACYYGVFRLVRLHTASRFILLGLLFYILSEWCGVVSMANAGYFMAGSVVRQTVDDARRLQLGSWFALIPLVLLCLDPAHLDKTEMTGAAIVVLVFSVLFRIYPLLRGRLQLLLLYVGRNTLPLLLFSPLFTILAKSYQPFLLQIDSTGMIFMVVSVALAVVGSYAITYGMDRTGFSRFFFGKSRALN